MVELLPDTPTVLLHVREMDHSRVSQQNIFKLILE